MKKLFWLLFVLICFSLHLYSQSDICEELKTENEYLKKMLKINTPIVKSQKEDVEITISKIEGNSNDQVVTVTLLLTNTSANRNFQWSGGNETKAVDIEGNSYKIGFDSRINKLYTDVPTKSLITIQQILPKTKMLKLVALSFYSKESPGRSVVTEFRDLSIEWK